MGLFVSLDNEEEEIDDGMLFIIDDVLQGTFDDVDGATLEAIFV